MAETSFPTLYLQSQSVVFAKNFLQVLKDVIDDARKLTFKTICVSAHFHHSLIRCVTAGRFSNQLKCTLIP